MADITPMMQQYLNIKEKHKDCILFFRLGDFYEMFFDDAVNASRELEITLTGRNCGREERAPMCGVPFHSADSYIKKLISKGYKVAICEQVEDPADAKGIVKREVIRIITPGTIIDTKMLDEKCNNYLACIYCEGNYYGMSVVDISTGEFMSTQVTWGNTNVKLIDEIAKYVPREAVVNEEFFKSSATKKMAEEYGIYLSKMDNTYFDRGFAFEKLKKYFNNLPSKSDKYLSVISAAALVEYLEQTQKVELMHIKDIEFYEIEQYMIIDAASRRNLEITETMRDKKRKGSLLWVIDKTVTSMGARTLKKWVEQPLINTDDINKRLDGVSELVNEYILRMEITEALKGVYDIERLIGKIIVGNCNCRDFISLKNSIAKMPYIKELTQKLNSSINKKCSDMIDMLDDLYDLLEKAVNDEPPVTVKEGGIIKKGYDNEVDSLRSAATDGKKWVAKIEKEQRSATGIKNLKVGFNKVFGYYIEVTKSYINSVPETYIRKQTLSNCERYITDELKKIEEKILGAEDKLIILEYKLFCELREHLLKHTARLKNTASAVSILDTLCSLANAAEQEGYVKPKVTDGDVIDIKEGRHPVVGKMVREGEFVPNDTILDTKDNRMAVITGPNMAGKSTYMRQTALIALLAQAGSFVPAKRAVIGIADRIFTRVGASDNLAAGQSTFMVEMKEVANILKNATKKSLLILDEIGRGTSTFDGLSIAWAVIEYISSSLRIGARTLFATHYHELTELEGKVEGIKNYCITADKKGDDIVFLRKIVRGGADESYGIQVARLAGVPQAVTDRSKEILKLLENADISRKRIRISKKPLEGQMDITSFNRITKKEEGVIKKIKETDLQKITPFDAMNLLYTIQQELKT